MRTPDSVDYAIKKILMETTSLKYRIYWELYTRYTGAARYVATYQWQGYNWKSYIFSFVLKFCDWPPYQCMGGGQGT